MRGLRVAILRCALCQPVGRWHIRVTAPLCVLRAALAKRVVLAKDPGACASCHSEKHRPAATAATAARHPRSTKEWLKQRFAVSCLQGSCLEAHPRGSEVPATGGELARWLIRQGQYITLGELFVSGARRCSCWALYRIYKSLDICIRRAAKRQAATAPRHMVVWFGLVSLGRCTSAL